MQAKGFSGLAGFQAIRAQPISENEIYRVGLPDLLNEEVPGWPESLQASGESIAVGIEEACDLFVADRYICACMISQPLFAAILEEPRFFDQ